MTSFNQKYLILKAFTKKTALLIFSFTSLFTSSYNAFSQAALDSSHETLSYHSIIPDTFHGGYSAADNANIMLILDSSGSMGYTDPETNPNCSGSNPNRNANCANRTLSRSSKVRAGIRAVLNDPEVQNTVNFGLMSFKTNAHETFVRDTVPGRSHADNGAILRAPIDSLSNTQHLTRLQRLLRQENTTYFAFQQNYSGLDTNGAINSWGGTPIEGSLLAGLRYFTNDSLQQPALDLLGAPNPSGSPNLNTSISNYDTRWVRINGQWRRQILRDGVVNTAIRSLNPPERSECPAQSAIILLTDGLPSGIYYLRVATGSELQTISLSIIGE